jgi:hypothetical protein
MARIRTIKPDFWTDEKLTECSLSARLLFIGTLNFADDNGNLQASAKKLKMQIFPADNIDCQPLLDELLTHGILIEYSVNGEKFLNIKNFKKHQVINRPSKSNIPQPIGSEDSVSAPEELNDGREGKGKEIEKPKTNVRTSSARFNEFWLSWPSSSRKVAKQACEKKWSAKKLDLLADQILDHLSKIKNTKQWLDGFEPAPLTYINQGRWADEIFTGEGKSVTKPWYISSTGIAAKGKELGVEPIRDENPVYYKERVYVAAGITNEMIRAANQDYGSKKVA